MVAPAPREHILWRFCQNWRHQVVCIASPRDPLQRWVARVPVRHALVEVGGMQHGCLVERPTDELRGERQGLRREARGEGHCRLPGQVEQVRDAGPVHPGICQ